MPEKESETNWDFPENLVSDQFLCQIVENFFFSFREQSCKESGLVFGFGRAGVQKMLNIPCFVFSCASIEFQTITLLKKLLLVTLKLRYI